MSDIDLLNGTIYGEWYGVIAYELAIGTGLLDDATIGVANKFKQDHIEHANHLSTLVKERGGEPTPRPADDVVANDLPEIKTADDIINYAISLESAAAINDINSIAKYTDPALGREIARIAAVETMHWSALLAATGQNPAPHAFIPHPEGSDSPYS